MTQILHRVEPTGLHEVWDYIEDGLESCRMHDSADTWIQDIYASIRYGQSTLYVGYIDGKYAGFVLLMYPVDPHSGRRYMHIWYAHNQSGFDVLGKADEELVKMAQSMGAHKITYRSDRMSFERLTRHLGYVISEIELSKEIDYG